jgi:hypothetical protein
VNSHESIILINNQLALDEIDAFFGLEEGTFNPAEHKLIFSVPRKEGYMLEYYINLPVNNMHGQYSTTAFACDIDYESVRHFGFYDYQVGLKNIIIRIIEKNTNSTQQLNRPQVIAYKYLSGNYKFGEINILDISKNGISKPCK